VIFGVFDFLREQPNSKRGPNYDGLWQQAVAKVNYRAIRRSIRPIGR